jgi:hypothetical protein
VAKRPELHEWKKHPMPRWKRAMFFAAIAIIPIVIFSLLLYLAR